MENYFHPLSNIDREEDVKRIITTLPPPIISKLLALARLPLVSHFHIFFSRIGREISRSKVVVFYNLGVVVTMKLQPQVQKDIAVERRAVSYNFSVERRALAHTRLTESLAIEDYLPMLK